jgi:pimeloyl-ACP methyl ester carboxylesterase
VPLPIRGVCVLTARGSRSLWRRGLFALGGAVVLLLAASLSWLKLHETELVFQAARSQLRIEAALPADAEALTLPLKGGGALEALLVRPQAAHDNGLWVLHLHGNAASAFQPDQVRHCEQLGAAGFHVLCFDYRGFGRSAGTASESHMREDAEAAYQGLLARGVAPPSIIIWGHSLGSAPAVELAVRHADAAALVLFGAFTSIDDVAAATYPYLPVRWIVGIHMASLQRIGSVHVPIVVAHAVGDQVIPYRQALLLFAAAHEPKQLWSLHPPASGRLGGHVDALYDQLHDFAPQLVRFVTAAARRSEAR